MSDLDTISTSMELTADVVAQAASSSHDFKRLVMRIAEIARADQGWTKLFAVIAQVATAEWLEGDLEVDFTGDDKGTTISFHSVLGAGMRERLFATQHVQLPVGEFQRAALLDPRSIAPLHAHQGLHRLTLTKVENVHSGSASAEPPRSSLDSVQRGWTPSNSVHDKDAAEFEVEERAKVDSQRVTAVPPVITAVPPVITAVPPVITAVPPAITTVPPVITVVPPVITVVPPADPSDTHTRPTALPPSD